jgi:hypothetical protein
MNTLNREQTSLLFPRPENYQQLRTHWSELINSDRRHGLTAAHHLIYLALLGKDWRKGFTPPSNPRKLANGAYRGWAMFKALVLFHSKYHETWLLDPFDGLVTPVMLAQTRERVPKVGVYSYRCEEYHSGSFPFEAYLD